VASVPNNSSTRRYRPKAYQRHSNIWPAFGLLLLVPGAVAFLLLGFTFWSFAAAILVNVVTWYYALKALNGGPEQP
jgi:hypothetical protein